MAQSKATLINCASCGNKTLFSLDEVLYTFFCGHCQSRIVTGCAACNKIEPAQYAGKVCASKFELAKRELSIAERYTTRDTAVAMFTPIFAVVTVGGLFVWRISYTGGGGDLTNTLVIGILVMLVAGLISMDYAVRSLKKKALARVSSWKHQNPRKVDLIRDGTRIEKQIAPIEAIINL